MTRIGAHISSLDFFRGSTRILFALCVAWIVCAHPASAQSLTRDEALKVAESFVNHRWESSAKNLRHGRDADGVEIHTPDRDGGHGTPMDACWRADAENLGCAYNWGGFETPRSLDAACCP